MTAERNTHSSQENLVAPGEVKVRVRKKDPAGIFPSQSDHVVVEDFKREAPRVSLDIRLEEVVPPLKEIPSMIQLDTWQLGESVVSVFEVESVVDSTCRKDCGKANSTSNELVFFARDRMQDGGIESRHKTGSEGSRREGAGSYLNPERQSTSEPPWGDSSGCTLFPVKLGQ